MPIANDIEYMFKKEMEAGLYGLNLLKEKKIYLPEDEINFLAMHIVNARLVEDKDNVIQNNLIIKEITQIIEKEFSIKVDEKNYSIYNKQNFCFKVCEGTITKINFVITLMSILTSPIVLLE